jgi:trans-aconitate methyltransferase
MAELVVPAYLEARTPWGGSGKSGTEEDWERSRSLIADAIDRDGTFLDVGCANGYLMECVPRWSRHAIEPSGVDISPELVALARTRLPDWAERIWVGNALSWEPPHRFTYIRTNLEYVPRSRRRQLVEHLSRWCERLILGVFNEQVDERATEATMRSWGSPVAGRTERPHREELMTYRCVWVDPW